MIPPKRCGRCWKRSGDKQSSFLLEKFVPGDVYHVDSVVSEKAVVFSSVSRYGAPPMAVAQQGGIFTTYLLPNDSPEAVSLRQLNRDLIRALGLVRGVSHAEFIGDRSDGNFYFLECAARVGGAYICEMVETATGINLWREWARIEIAGGKQPYHLPATRSDYAGIDSFASPPGRAGYLGLQRSRDCLAPEEATPRRTGPSFL